MLELILASTSAPRRLLLERLGIPFNCVAPIADETPKPGESAETLVERLAIAKARSVTEQYPEAIILGADQVAHIDDRFFGKPKDHDDAVAQLEYASGKEVVFVNGLCLINTQTGNEHTHVSTFSIRYRTLTRTMIEHYLRLDQPYNCAGSIKAESLGVCLFESMSGRDPNTVLGLPLIALVRLLEAEGMNPLNQPG